MESSSPLRVLRKGKKQEMNFAVICNLVRQFWHGEEISNQAVLDLAKHTTLKLLLRGSFLDCLGKDTD